MMVLVSVERILALTPLPRPSASTAMVEFSVRRICTLSPQSSSLFLLTLLNAASICIFMIRFPPEDEVVLSRLARDYASSESKTIMFLSFVRDTFVSAVVSPRRLAIC